MPGVPIDTTEPLEEGRDRTAKAASDRAPALATAPELAELFGRLLEPGSMLEVFRRELPSWSREPLRILSCSVKAAKTASSRRLLRDGRAEFVYHLEIESGAGVRREIVLFGLAPFPAGFPGPELERRCRDLRDHPAAAPFRRLALRLRSLPLGILVFPLDPALPALAEITGPAAPEILAPHFPECRAGARIGDCTHELRHYKPGQRAVLRVRVALRAPGAAPSARRAYLKLFADERGAASHRVLRALWDASRGSRWLRVPEPLGYDEGRRMLVLAEVPGGRALAEWIHCLEHDLPLPHGVSLERLENGVLAAARALAELQRCDVRPEARRSFEDVLASLRKDRELLEQRAHGTPPALVARALALIERLEASAPEGEALVPSHGGARHKQTVGDEHGLTFVDWDGFCLANPALDAATFLARLRLEPILDPANSRNPPLARLAENFRAEFLGRAPAAAQHLALYEGLVLAEQMLRSFRRSSDEGLRNAAERLASAADERLERADCRN